MRTGLVVVLSALLLSCGSSVEYEDALVPDDAVTNPEPKCYRNTPSGELILVPCQKKVA